MQGGVSETSIRVLISKGTKTPEGHKRPALGRIKFISVRTLGRIGVGLGRIGCIPDHAGFILGRADFISGCMFSGPCIFYIGPSRCHLGRIDLVLGRIESFIGPYRLWQGLLIFIACCI